MRKYIFLFLITIISSSCTSENENSEAIEKTYIDRDTQKDTLQEKKKIEKTTDFYFENDTLVQMLSIEYLSDSKIKFNIVVTNKTSGNESELVGVAVKQNGDPEIDEDNDGNSYPATAYLYENNCWLSFRIESDAKAFARIIEADCNTMHKLDCPFGSLGILVLKR